MAEFIYNIGKNASIGDTSFELKCGYHSKVSYIEDTNPYSKSRFIDKVAIGLHKLMSVYKDNI